MKPLLSGTVLVATLVGCSSAGGSGGDEGGRSDRTDCPSGQEGCGDLCVPSCGSNEFRNFDSCACECAPGTQWSGAACEPTGAEGATDADADSDADVPPPGDGGYCEPCAANTDCGGGGNLCFSSWKAPGVLFCGVACESDATCPFGAACVDITTPEGPVGRNCAPRSGLCG